LAIDNNPHSRPTHVTTGGSTGIPPGKVLNIVTNCFTLMEKKKIEEKENLVQLTLNIT